MSLEKIAEKIVKAQVKAPWMFLAVALVITLVLAPGLMNLFGNVEPSLEKVLPQDIHEVKLMNQMRTEYGADMVYILLYTTNTLADVRNYEVLRYEDLLAQKIRKNDYVLDVVSTADLVKEQNNNILPQSYDEIKNILHLDPRTPLYVKDDYSLAIMQVRTDTGAEADVVKKVIDSIDDDIASLEQYNPGLEAKITGFNAIDKATFEIIISDFILITLFSFILISLTVYFTFRSLTKGLMPMIVVMVAIIWTMGIVGYVGITITVVTMVAAAMLMGLGIDFGIHIVHNFFELRKTLNPEKSLEETMKELLRAMIGSSFTTSAGFLALLFGTLPTMKNLGIILAIGIIATLLGAVFVLPVVVYLYDRSKSKKSSS